MQCSICPQHCGADRELRAGFCAAPWGAVVAKTMVHHWEEPPISGTAGSGAIFFEGCNLHCVYCQNAAISRKVSGNEETPQSLAQRMLDLQGVGAHNINLLSPAHVAPSVAAALKLAKNSGLSIPVVYNTNAYEKTTTLQLLEGLVDIYLPDFKYYDDETALHYSSAARYYAVATAAILEMHRQVGACVFDENGLMQRGMLIRHLVLPGQRHSAMRILDWIAANLPEAYISLMAQYIPAADAARFPPLGRRITTLEYQSVVEYCRQIGLHHTFVQNRTAASEGFVPDFKET